MSTREYGAMLGLGCRHSRPIVCRANRGTLTAFMCLLTLQVRIKKHLTLLISGSRLKLFCYLMALSDLDYSTLLKNSLSNVSYTSSCNLYHTNNSNAHEVPTTHLILSFSHTSPAPQSLTPLILCYFLLLC